MTRTWTEWVAALGDHLPLGLAALLLILLGGLIGAALYFWPAWLPWRWLRLPRLGRPRLRWPGLRWPWRWSWRWMLRWPWRRRPKKTDTEPALPEPVAADELPDLPAAAFLSLADQLAAQGRFAEAVRERLRAIVRELIDAGLVDNRPGWTVTELATAAGGARPPVRPGLDAASRLFSDIWYGQRPATAGDDQRYRRCSRCWSSSVPGWRTRCRAPTRPGYARTTPRRTAARRWRKRSVAPGSRYRR
jgi:hypothetical protein